MTGMWISVFTEIFIITATVIFGGLFLVGAVAWIVDTVRELIRRRNRRK